MPACLPALGVRSGSARNCLHKGLVSESDRSSGGHRDGVIASRADLKEKVADDLVRRLGFAWRRSHISSYTFLADLNKMLTPESLAALAVFVLANLAAASSGALFRPGAWYASLAKPSWTPPNWAFPVVWSVLFVLNAVAGWLVWTAAGAGAAGPLTVYGVSLVINASWSGVFFGARRMGLGFVIVAALWLSIALVMVVFVPVSPLAAGLIAPYLAWVTIASALNLRVWQLNSPRRASA